ncbi:serine/threonine protein kinase [Synechococcus sp. PCC 7502]|uniref:serine/threonine-protein kinase n=1 Tax=Synechococcus sp. PCC 7502 TaxID=1173263 RepID=UPI00029FA09E|nr:serine/threonine-protein kinase [Synechococcus sp. PCC 7502]AFY73432.1 serine/threonine protein kinase [Synechococcus sp. PCC 7502]
MQPPILSGSILRDRYIIKNILGQGGMGRTYMAEDMERFNEPCVLKEFIPYSPTPEAIKKAKELFQREASILYQIKHPQVPQFRATFEASGRLFLVQDYVDGKTFRDILIECVKRKTTFSEAEVTELLLTVLPILVYLHSHHIIHRDISPENLILRNSDRLPVLIDFGVVKETATKLLSHSSHSTVVGKLGYAPPEQMQSGRAYPNSDLYALAATAVVLLTGKEPQELFDDVSLTWHWEQFASVSAGLKQVLDKMLSFKPNDRYSNAQEVLAALEFAQASLSQVKTFMVGAQPSVSNNQNLSTQLSTQLATQKFVKSQKSNLSGILLGIGLVVISGIGAWAIASLVLNYKDIPRTTIVPPPPSIPTNINKGLDLQNNQAKVSDSITADQTITYRLDGKKGQTLTAALTGSGLVMTLIYVDQKPIDNYSSNLTIGYWRGKLPATGAYFIIIKTASGTTESNYDLEVQLEEPVIPKPKPTPTPIPTPDPTANPNNSNNPEISKTLEFPPGLLSTSVGGNVKPQQQIRYSVNVLDGQTLEVGIIGNIFAEIINPDGVVVWDSNNINPPKITKTLSGNYQILVRTKGDTEAPYKLDVATSN